MRKIETIWHHLLISALNDKKYKHTQQELAYKFSYSLSTINHALEAPFKIGAIRKESKFFVLENFQKLLYFWASMRNFEKDVIYSTYFDAGVFEIEGLAPSGVIYACYSSARRILSEAPADYSKVYFYVDESSLTKLQERFPPSKKGAPNVFVLKTSNLVSQSDGITTLPQTFVDIWNLKDWYSKDFTQALEGKINGILS